MDAIHQCYAPLETKVYVDAMLDFLPLPAYLLHPQHYVAPPNPSISAFTCASVSIFFNCVFSSASPFTCRSFKSSIAFNCAVYVSHCRRSYVLNTPSSPDYGSSSAHPHHPHPQPVAPPSPLPAQHSHSRSPPPYP